MKPVHRAYLSSESRRALSLRLYALLASGLIIISSGHTQEPRSPLTSDSIQISDIQLELVRIASGKFIMGSPRTEHGHEYDEHQHEVTLRQAFWMGTHEITVGQWKVFTKERGHVTEAERSGGLYGFKEGLWRFIKGATWQNPGFPQDDQHPVVGVNWYDAKAFCRWLTTREQQAERLPKGYIYTLPSEAQWEFACRAGSSGRFIGDSLDTKAEIWYKFGAGGGIPNTPKTTHPVGQKRVNAWGLYDVHGNVWEWCDDWYQEDLIEASSDPIGPPSGKLKVCRGGAWSSAAKSVRSAMRGRDNPNDRGTNLGFRISLRIKPPN